MRKRIHIQKIAMMVAMVPLVVLLSACKGSPSPKKSAGAASTATANNSANNQSTVLSAITISAPTSNPYIANASSITLTGSCSTNATVYLSGAVNLNTLCINSEFQLVISPQATGSLVFSIRQTATNATPSTPVTFTWMRDSSLPVSPTITSPVQPYHSNTSTITIGGTCTNGHTVELGGAATATTTCISNFYSFNTSKTADGIHEYNVLQKNSDGVASGLVNFTWNRDTVAPSAPAITVPGTHPFSSSLSNLTISGSCESDSTVQLSGSETNSMACANGLFSFTVNRSTDGTYQFALSQSDRAGNNSPATLLTWNRDSIPPAPLTITNRTSPFVSNSPSLILSGGCESGSIVNVSGDSSQNVQCFNNQYSVTIPKGSDGTFVFSLKQTDPAGMSSSSLSFTWTRDTQAPLPIALTNPISSPHTSSNTTLAVDGSCENTATVSIGGDSNYSTTCSNSSFTFTISKPTDGTFNFSLSQTDKALNTSAPITLQWIKTASAPSVPVIVSPASNPHQSTTSTLTLSGTCTTGMTVEMTGDATLSTNCLNNSFTFQVGKSADGSYAFNLRQKNSDLSYSDAASFTWIRDTSPPASVNLTSPASSPIYSNQNSLTLSGTCSVGNKVVLSGDTNTTETDCAQDQTFSFTVSKSTDLSYQFSIVQKDTAGNSSTPKTQTWVRDTLAPAAVTVTSPANHPHISSDNSVTLSGACEANATVILSGDESSSAICSSLGSYSITVSKTVDSTYSFNLIQTDRAGNSSSDTAFTWIRNTSIPSSPVITTPVTSPYLSNQSSLTIVAECDTSISPLAAIVTLSGDVTAAQVSSPSEQLSQPCTSSPVSFTLLKSTDGSYNFQLRQSNPNNALASSYSTLQWKRDTVAPSTPTINNPSVSPYTSSGDLTISGGCEANATVVLSGDATDTTTCTLANNYNFTVSKSMDSAYSFSISQTDPAGNTSPSIDLTWYRYNGSINPPVITAPASNPFNSSNSTLTISGTCNDGFQVALSGDASGSQVCSGGAFSFTANKSVSGTYTFSLKQIYGSVESSPVSLTWVRETQAPIVTLTPAIGATNIKLSADFSFTSNKSGSTFQCKLDTDADYSSCSSPLTYASIANGNRSISVRATDSSGNTSAPAIYNWVQKAHKTIALYHFNNSGILTDSGNYTSQDGFANNLAITASPGPTNDISTGALPVASPQGRQMTDGFTYLVNDNASLRVGTDKITIEGRVKFWSLPSTNNYFTVISKTGASGNLGWEVRLKKMGANRYRYEFVASLDGTTTSTVFSSEYNPTGWQFHYFAITWDRGTVTFYHGQNEPVLAGSGTIGNPGTATLFPSTGNLRLGRNQTTGTAPSQAGTIGVDEFRLSQTIRSPAATTLEFNPD
jgi:uncharacterized protein YegP (UPF0339 family)